MKIVDLPNWDPHQRLAAAPGTLDLVVLPKPTTREREVSAVWLRDEVKPRLRPGGRIAFVTWARSI